MRQLCGVRLLHTLGRDVKIDLREGLGATIDCKTSPREEWDICDALHGVPREPPIAGMRDVLVAADSERWKI